MRSIFALLFVVGVPTFASAAPGAAGVGKVLAEYNSATGELIVSSGGAVNFFVQSASNKISPLSPAPTVPIGLLTNNASRVGITNLGPINLTDYSFGSIGRGIPFSDLSLHYTPSLGQNEVVIPACSTGFNPMCPEPSSLGLMGFGLIGLLSTRRRQR